MSKLQDKILYDLNSSVRKTAIKAMDKINSFYAQSIDIFIEVIFSALLKKKVFPKKLCFFTDFPNFALF